MTTHASVSSARSARTPGLTDEAGTGSARASGATPSGGPSWGRREGVPTGPTPSGPAPSGFAACGLDGRLRNAPQARRFVASTLSGWALDRLVPDAELVVSELVTNAVQHALDPTAWETGDYPVWLGIFLNPGDLVCAVTDPSSRPPCLRAPDDCALGGRGLALIEALSTSWSWELTPPRGKTVWAALPLPAGLP
ncbi:ATP-binding protein [Streptomyces sp. NPDC048057]|uniref:ATP-binding protein n=1 Tax=Streptomyces sp. NPDC048057 TaxID=3155628 RepID=UPI003408FE71